jgi:hypothetical protein
VQVFAETRPNALHVAAFDRSDSLVLMAAGGAFCLFSPVVLCRRPLYGQTRTVPHCFGGVLVLPSLNRRLEFNQTAIDVKASASLSIDDENHLDARQ